MFRNKRSWILGVVIIGFLYGAASAETVVARSKGQTLFVPVYSHIYSGDNERPSYLSATLSIRNPNADGPISIITVDYYDSRGQLVKRYLDQPARLGPMSSTRYVIAESDKAGGSGASFIVKWSAPQTVLSPVVESVMISTRSQLGISFTSVARVIEEAKE